MKITKKWSDLAAGKVKEGFDKLEQMNAIREIEDPHERYQQIAKDYLASLHAPKLRDGRSIFHGLTSDLQAVSLPSTRIRWR